MANYPYQTYPQEVYVFHHAQTTHGLPQQQLFAMPVIQQLRNYRNCNLPHQIYTEYFSPQHTQVLMEKHLLYHSKYYNKDLQHTLSNLYFPQKSKNAIGSAETTSTQVCHNSKSRRQFHSHYAENTSRNAYICNVFNKRFMEEWYHWKHYSILTGAKQHVCDICNKSFTSKNHLRQHSLIHTVQKPHVCDICQLGFTQKPHLRNHYFIHNKEKNYTCGICNKNFARKDSLKRHCVVHSVDRKQKKNKNSRQER